MKNILLLSSGSVAVIKVNKLKNLLIKSGFKVKIVVSDYVKNNFNDYNSLEAITLDKNLNSYPQHIKLAKWADLVILAPASANTMAKLAFGIADNDILTILLATTAKVLICPAMNTIMYRSLQKREVITKLAKLNFMFLGPEIGKLRENLVGLGRMSEPEQIIQAVNNLARPPKEKILLIYGSSKIKIDAVRYLGNKSSGIFGKTLANALKVQGAEVEAIETNDYSNEELLDIIIKKLEFKDTYISIAALADFTVESISNKIKRETISEKGLDLHLTRNIDILTNVKTKFPKKKIIGFKLDENIECARKKLKELDLDAIFFNKLDTINSNNVEGVFIAKNSEVLIPFDTKVNVAEKLAKAILQLEKNDI